MSDTKVLKAPGGWPPSEEISTVSEKELREWMKEISNDLKAALKDCADHKRESAVFKENIGKRVSDLEGHIERRSAFKTAITLAGWGALFGGLASAIGKKTGLW